MRVVIVPLMFLALFVGDMLGKRMSSSPLRIAYNLVVLVGLTATIDLITGAQVATLPFMTTIDCISHDQTYIIAGGHRISRAYGTGRIGLPCVNVFYRSIAEGHGNVQGQGSTATVDSTA